MPTFMDCVCFELGIDANEKDAVVMNIRKHLEDFPGEEISIDRVSGNSGVAIEKVKNILFILLHERKIVCATKDKKYLHFYGKNTDGSTVN